jgi:hypothetical protein
MRIGRNRKGKPRKRMGRPVDYRPEYVGIAYQACRLKGLYNHELAALFGVTPQTLCNWKNEHPEFFDAIRNGKDEWDNGHVENALLRRAEGYDQKVIEEKLTKDGDVVPCEKTVHIPPDVGAAIFWLCNRNPQRWRQLTTKINQMFLPGADGKMLQQVNDGSVQAIGKEGNGGQLEVQQYREIVDALRVSGALNVAGALDISIADEPVDGATKEAVDAAAK